MPKVSKGLEEEHDHLSSEQRTCLGCVSDGETAVFEVQFAQDLIRHPQTCIYSKLKKMLVLGSEEEVKRIVDEWSNNLPNSEKEY